MSDSSKRNNGGSRKKGIPTPLHNPDPTLLGEVDPAAKPHGRESLPTPYLAPYPALMMIQPGRETTLACVNASVALQLRPVLATTDTMFEVATSSRPLVIVVDGAAAVDEGQLTDLAVSVGAQLIRTEESDTADALSKRIRVAAEASRRLRESNRP